MVLKHCIFRITSEDIDTNNIKINSNLNCNGDNDENDRSYDADNDINIDTVLDISTASNDI